MSAFGHTRMAGSELWIPNAANTLQWNADELPVVCNLKGAFFSSEHGSHAAGLGSRLIRALIAR
eukprot:1981826-Prymnesium_polylepis.1